MFANASYFTRLHDLASKALRVRYDPDSARQPCHMLAHELEQMLNRWDKGGTDAVDVINFLRMICAEAFTEYRDYYLQSDKCSRERLYEKVLDLYAYVSAVAHGCSCSRIVVHALHVIAGTAAACAQLLTLNESTTIAPSLALLPPPPAAVESKKPSPRSGPILVFENGHRVSAT
jgi:phytoene/squalene synthetase